MTEEIKFEKAMEQLEKIVGNLEGGDLSLEDALKGYEEGVRLSRNCQNKLTQAEKKIEVLTRALDGSLQAEPFDPEASDAKEAPEKRPLPKKGRKSSSQNENFNEDDLLI